MPYLARASLLVLFTAATLPACSVRTLDSDGTDTGTSEDASSTPVTTDAPPTTGDPMAPNPTTMSPTSPGDPSTSTSTGTSTSTSTTADPSTTTSTAGTTSGDPSDPSLPGTSDDPSAPTRLDMGTPAEVPEGIWEGCTKVAPPGTAIKGESSQGPLTSTRAYFGYTEANGTLWGVRLLFLDDSADSDLAFAELVMGGEISTGPAADVRPSQKFTVENPFWVGTDPEATLAVVAGNKTSFVFTTVDITGHQGSWDVNNPADPARLQGSLNPGPGRFQLLGDFDAVFCDSLTDHVIVE